MDDLVDGRGEGRHHGQRRLRGTVGVKDGDFVPGLGWLRLLANILLWAGFAAAVLYIWGLSRQGFSEINLFLTEGFEVAGFNIVPSRLLLAVLVFALLLTLSRWITARLNSKWLQKTRMDRGAREALVTFSGYVIVALAILFALSVAGIEFTNLAIVAGALSVGIGFGLQNVVNNFVSGLVLLFERPIQVGDTVQLTDVWGAIKRIGLRASVIRTFDGAEVIVPNGLLISDKVTNWTLSDRRRRIEVEVGVDYGTPAQRVIDLLVGVAMANPKVINEPEPCAYFVNFGDSALEFKLWAWSEFSDAGYSIRSELAVAVQKALEHAGIDVPFPQRDLHLVSVSPNAAPDLGTATQPSPRPNPTSGSDEGS